MSKIADRDEKPVERNGTIALDDLRSDVSRRLFASNGEDRIGVEIEFFPVVWASARTLLLPCPFERSAGAPCCLLDAVERLASDGTVTVDHRASGTIRGRWNAEVALSFEPGAQIELSTSPKASWADGWNVVAAALVELDERLSALGVRLCCSGVNPWHAADRIGMQCRAPRFLAMAEYFRRNGSTGFQMMLQTCSMHVNLDFGPATHSLRRWRAANLLAPFLVAIFANSPILEGRPTGFVSNRNRIWGCCDATRAGLPAIFANRSLDCREQYLQFALDANVMMVRESEDEIVPTQRNFSFRQWLTDGGPPGVRGPTRDDWEYHLGTLFSSVVPRSYLEIRYVDCPLRPWLSVPATVLSALLYDDELLSWICRELSEVDRVLPELTSAASRRGLHDRRLLVTSQTLFQRALLALDRNDSGFYSATQKVQAEEFYRNYVEKGRSQADDQLEAAAKGNRPLEDLLLDGRDFDEG